MTERRPGPRRAASAVLALGAVVLGPIDSHAATPTDAPTFDWPLDCPATVTQRYDDETLTVDVTYEVAAVEVESIPGVVAVEFGPAVVDGASGIDESSPQLAAFFTNPVVEVESDGSPVEAVGFEEWLEAFAGARGGPVAAEREDELERDITHRVVDITWASWVGLWSTLPEFDGDVVVETGDDGWATYLAEWTGADQEFTIELVTDPSTLLPERSSYAARALDEPDDVVAYEWTFDWPACDGGRSTADLTAAAEAPAVAVPPGFDTIAVDELPPEALDTLALIEAGGPFPYSQDGAVFENREGLLPEQPYGYYHEYTVETPGSEDRGARRLVTGEEGELFYTDDHYDSFRVVIT